MTKYVKLFTEMIKLLISLKVPFFKISCVERVRKGIKPLLEAFYLLLGLKISWLKGREGSSPSRPTSLYKPF